MSNAPIQHPISGQSSIVTQPWVLWFSKVAKSLTASSISGSSGILDGGSRVSMDGILDGGSRV